MIRVAPWEVAGVTVRPLTVRERIGLSEALASRRAKDAAADAIACGMSRDEAMKAASKAREDARVSSAIVLEAFTPAGSMAVLDVAAGVDGASRLAASLDLAALSNLACECLGIDIEAAAETAARSQGKAQAASDPSGSGTGSATHS